MTKNNTTTPRTVFVTGGARGIGQAIATLFAHNGYRVGIIDCMPPEDPALSWCAHNPAYAYAQADVRNKEQVTAAFASLLQTLGSTTLDVLVNNAGVTRDGMAVRMALTDWQLVLDVNLTGAFICAQQALLRMMKAQNGSIINISSIVGIQGNAGQANYAASKAGLIGLTKSLAREYAGRQIRVNAVAPGFIQTAMTALLSAEQQQTIINQIPLGRAGTPDDVAHAVLFLASDAAAYLTGQVLEITGGL